MSSYDGARSPHNGYVHSFAPPWLRDLWSGALDLVYPPKCLVCGEFQPRYLCVKCASRIDYLEPPVCDQCGLPVDDGFCRNIHCKTLSFTRARAVAVYDGVIRLAIHQLKYSGQTVLIDDFHTLLVDFLARNDHFASDATAVVPVPIHPSRERERGFNQSALLAEGIAEYLRLPLPTRALQRVGGLLPQVDLSEQERIENVRGAFKVLDAAALDGQRVLLVDDVLTTGSTASEASKTLRSAGVTRIYVLTLARSC
jgi:competence protein ComFC